MAKKNEELIRRVSKVGEGGFGIVYLGSYREYKEVGIKDIKGKVSEEALIEANILKKLTHPNIIQYIDIVQTKNKTSLIMEFIDGGSLYSYISRTPQSSAYWKATRQMMIDVAYGMSYLHGEHIVHADLKSLNVLLRHNYDAVICDFGLARTIADSNTMITSSVEGTVAWFAPELCFDQPERNSFPSDVWAFGCILSEITSKKAPWEDYYQDTRVFLNALAKPKNAIIFENICRTQRAPEKLRAILCRCCTWQKTERPTFPTIVRELLAISDVDLLNINEGNEKPSASNSSSVKPSTGAKPSSTKTSSKDDFDDCATSMTVLKLENPKAPRKPSAKLQTDDSATSLAVPKLENSKAPRKPSAKYQTDDSANQSTSDDSKKYDPIHGYLYKGPRGGWYYLGSTGKKIYIKNDDN